MLSTCTYTVHKLNLTLLRKRLALYPPDGSAVYNSNKIHPTSSFPNHSDRLMVYHLLQWVMLMRDLSNGAPYPMGKEIDELPNRRRSAWSAYSLTYVPVAPSAKQRKNRSERRSSTSTSSLYPPSSVASGASKARDVLGISVRVTLCLSSC